MWLDKNERTLRKCVKRIAKYEKLIKYCKKYLKIERKIFEELQNG
jgi:hypothetical protein